MRQVCRTFPPLGLALLFCSAPIVTGGESQAGFFLPRNPVAAAYVLGRLSNRELIAAPRSEFVYVALLERQGLEKKFRLEALEGLVALRHSERVSELLKGIEDLDKKGAESEPVLRDLGALLLQSRQAELVARREDWRRLASQGRLSLTRQIGWAAGIGARENTEVLWQGAQSNPGELADLASAVALLPDPQQREAFYPKLASLLEPQTSPELIRAAAQSIISIPAHDAATFSRLAALVDKSAQTPVLIESLARIPQAAWPRDRVEPLSHHILEYLGTVPPEHRAEPAFAEALQFANELASLLPADAAQALKRALRNLGPTIVTLHAIYEQMRFDQERIVAEPGKPLVIFLQNDDAMPHNLAVLAPGSLQEIGPAAEKMPPEPDAEGRLYVPASPKVLHATRLVAPGQKIQLAFDTPVEPGDYPFLCTFPGHWLRMSGVLTIVPDVERYLAQHPSSAQPALTEWKLSDFTADLLQAPGPANAAAGRELFTRLACVQCHKLGSQGYAYGPDLTGVFQKYKNDKAAVLQQILEPSKLIEDRYRNYNFELKSGDSVIGMILKEDDQSLTIQTGPADSLIQVLHKSEIQKRRGQGSSPMPVGLLNALSKGQILDLLAYLQSGGQALPEHHHHLQRADPGPSSLRPPSTPRRSGGRVFLPPSAADAPVPPVPVPASIEHPLPAGA